MTYAADTRAPITKTKTEIQTLLAAAARIVSGH